MSAPIPHDEPARLEALRSYDVLDTLPEHVYDDIVKLAAQICGAPIALLTLIDQDRQWIKSRVGLEVTETGRGDAFCAHTILEDWLLIVPDTCEDSRFATHPAVQGKPNIRFYAGAPLRSPSGHAIGSLCVIDRKPRALDRSQQESLRALARQAMAQMELKRTVGALERMMGEREQAEQARRETDRRFNMFMNNSPAIAYMKDESGRFVYVNEPCARRFNIPVAQWLGKTDADLFGAEIAKPFREHDLKVLREEVTLTTEETTPAANGGTTEWLSHKFPMFTVDGRKELAGISVDITDRKQAEREREQLVEELQKAISEVKALSGLLPICASCKSIRNDDGYWQKMEAYLKEHASVEFTHGLCPGCVEKLYPDFAKSRREAGVAVDED